MLWEQIETETPQNHECAVIAIFRYDIEGIQPEFITVRATSPSYSTRASTPNMNPITEMDLRNDRNSHSIENGMNGMNGNHALEIEMDNQSMDDLDPMDNAASSSGPKRTMTDPQDVHIAVKEDDQIDKRPTV